MCGIAGCFVTAEIGPQLSARETVHLKKTRNRLLDALFHRGPDEVGYLDREGCCLGIRRLRVIALSNGSQPCVSSCGRFSIVFNGEIYNYLSLRSWLLDNGYQFRTDSDAEVIVNLYEHCGKSLFEHLEGMFAFAIYDEERGDVLLARDRAGKKPLHYYQDGEYVYFSSEPGELVKTVKQISIDFDSLNYYLSYRVVPAERSVIRGLNKVPPGGYTCFSDGVIHQEKYWRPSYSSSPVGTKSYDALLDELDSALCESVEKRLQAEVKTGTMLSGGLDSSLITAIARRVKGPNLNTFSIGFADGRFDESPYARTVADYLKTDHHEFVIEPDDAFKFAEQLIVHFGEPFAFPSSIASFAMFKLARRHVTVVLGGDGADELFGGYSRYRYVVDYPDVPVDHSLPRCVDLPTKSSDFPEFYLGLLTEGCSKQLKRELLSQASREQIELTEIFDQLKSELVCTTQTASNSKRLDAALQFDFKHWMREAQLVKVDIASMANSVEVREPFLDSKVIEIGTRLTANFKLDEDRRKVILYDLAKRYLPSVITDRPKQELAVPLEKWLTGHYRSLVTTTLTSERALSRGIFDSEKLIDFASNFQEDDCYAAWTLFCFERWCQCFLDHHDSQV
jgi:asparagine synthase (glutamine-hydrolysing)